MLKPHFRPAPMALAMALLAASYSSPPTALAQTQAAPALVTVNLAAQPLGDALNELARQARLQLMVRPDLVEGKHAPAVSGRYTLGEALQRVLAGSGLVAQVEATGVVIIKVPPPLAGGEKTLSAIMVTSQHDETANGPVGGLIARRAATGSKTDTPIIETPQSISVIPAEQIELMKPRDVAETLTYTAGVTRAAYVDRVADQFVVRGFTSTQPYLDGMRYQVGIYDGQMEPYALERVEVLKGAASTLYGSLPPGGLINTVSKQPTVEPLREIGVDVGNFHRKQVSADFGGALTDDGVWSYRLTTVVRDSDAPQDYTSDDRAFVAGALRWKPDARTMLTLRAEYQHDDTVYQGGYPLYGTVLPSPYGEVPVSRFIGEPGFDSFKVNRKVAGYLFEHEFNDALKLRHSLRHYEGNIHRQETLPRNYFGFTSAQRVFTRRGHDRFQISKGFTTDTSLEYKAGTGAVQHTAIVGVDYSRTRWRDEYYYHVMPDLDLFNPVYGRGIGALQRLDDSWGVREIRQAGIYVQDQMKVGKHWVFLAGGRQDHVNYDDYNPLTGDVVASNEKSNKFTGRLGAVYLADNGLAPFLGFSQSFQPQSGRDRSGARFKPTAGEQYELGLRYQPQGTNTQISAAIYQLTQENVTVSDPFDTSYSTQMGKVRSRGFELEARTRLGRDANLIGSYAYTDARTIKSSPLTPAEQGKRSAYTPYNQLSVWVDQGFGFIGLGGLRAGIGARYTGETREQGSTLTLPDYTLFDAMVSYTTGPWKLSLNLKNLGDKRYVTNCSYHTCFLGEPRTVIASAMYRW